MVFKGEGIYEKEPHDAPASMTGVLVILSLTAMVFWMAVGFYSERLLSGVTSHEIEAVNLPEMLSATAASPMALILTGVIVVVFFGLWMVWSKRGEAPSSESSLAHALVDTKFGFDSFYGAAVRMIGGFCQQLRRLQTGDLNYNVAGMAFGLILLLLLLVSNLLQVSAA